MTPIHWLESTTSTQDILHDLAAAGAPTGTAVVAAVQTLGRGSRGRTWASPDGGLWMSVLLRPASEPALEVLSLRVALAVALAIETVAPTLHFSLKWPNDLVLGSRKAGGILCEARWHGAALGWIAVGVGINVANPIPEELAGTAVALGAVAPGLTPAMIAPPVAAAVTGAGRRSGMLSPAELEAFTSRDWLRGKTLETPVAGVAEGVGADGSLLVRKPDGSVVGVRSGTASPAPA